MLFADVAELADALDLGSSVPDVRVQVPHLAPIKNKKYVRYTRLWLNWIEQRTSDP